MKAQILFIVVTFASGILYWFFPAKVIAIWKLLGPLARFDPLGRLMLSKYGGVTCKVLGVLMVLMGLMMLGLIAPDL